MLRLLFVILVGLVLAVSGLSALPLIAQTPPVLVVRGPIVQNPAGLATTAQLTLWTDALAEGLFLEYTPVGGSPVIVPVASTGLRHDVSLAGLQARTRYTYRVLDALGAQLASGGFTTLADPGDSLASVSFTAVGDFGRELGTSGGTQAARIAAFIADAAAAGALNITLGDNCYPSLTPELVDACWLGHYRRAYSENFVYPTYGNHDGISSGVERTAFNIFSPPTPIGYPQHRHWMYSVDSGPVHITAMYGGWTDTTKARTNEQIQWLRDDLAAADARGARWKIVVFHDAPWGDPDASAVARANRLNRLLHSPIWEEFQVDVVFAGDAHTYNRTRFIDDNGDGKGYLGVTSGAGATSSPPYNQKLGPGDEFVERVRGAVYPLVTIQGDQLTLEAYGVHATTGVRSLVERVFVRKDVQGWQAQ